MNAKPFSSVLIAMIGLYAIFSAILIAGLPLLSFVLSLFLSGGHSDVTGYTAVVCLPQFILPFGLGLFLFWRAGFLADRLLRRCGISADEAVLRYDDEVPALAFSLLGVFMLVTTLPGAMQDMAAWFQLKAIESRSYVGSAPHDFLRERLPTIIYHLTAIGCALFVFLRGKRIAAFAASLRKR